MNTPDDGVIAERLREEREWLGFTRADVAQALNLTEDVIAAYEAGEQVPDAAALARFAKLFGLHPDRLRGAPLAEDPQLAIACSRSDRITSEDRYTVMRFAEFLRHSPPAPRKDTPDE